jgi:hypothetical protein
MAGAREVSAAFTPGPWQVVYSEYCVRADRNTVARSVYEKANARLIAAAPDGYALAERILALFEYRGEDATDFAANVEAEARSFLAKARGDQ